MHKLPALQAIRHALKAVIQFRKAGTRIGLPWVLVLAVVTFLDRNFSVAPDSANSTTGMMLLRPTEFIIYAFSLVIFSSIAVNWHRYILLDEVTASEKIFRLDRPVWIYALRTLLIMAMTLLPIFIFFRYYLADLPGFSPLLVIAALFVAGIFIMRMSVALPATALERKDFGIGPALQVTRDNNLQFAALLALYILFLLATFLVLGITLAIVGSVNMTVARIFAVVLSVPVNLFLSLFSVSLLSSLYGFFVEQRKF